MNNAARDIELMADYLANEFVVITGVTEVGDIMIVDVKHAAITRI